MKVAVIERNAFGGTCVNTGCIPTKTMVASAYAARMAARAAEYGVEVGSVRVDMKRVMARKDAVSKASRTGLEDWLRNMENCTVYRGHARFESAHEVNVGGERLQADKIFINVGGRALVPDMPGLHEIDYFTNSSMMSVDFLPRHLIVVGGSYIGLEFGQMFRRFGAEVTIIEMGPRLVGREDEDVSTTIREIVEREGVEVRVNAQCISFAKRGDEMSPASSVPTGRRECTARTCCSPLAVVPIPTIWASRRRGSRSTRGATSWSTTSSVRASRESGRSGTATARGHSRTRRTTMRRS
jgi:pyruvate/2-oxoglutarate dehydrogenase complex dihydrolipoamide dehydrogenase (E3) component